MTALNGADSGTKGVRDDPRWMQYVLPAVVAALAIAMIVAIITTLGASGPSADAGTAASRRLPLYWTVHDGDSYSVIAEKTGLSVDQLETFNPYTNPQTIRPGQRLKLRLHMPPPKPKPKGPMFWTVRTGQSFGYIAAKTGHSIYRLRKLNPRLKATALQPGDRMRLRR
ncbi:MAG TPA: LysM peptidoglycan-binding domain-containing protein [Solirubrobacteraceae bacterium]|nr:LysM peptidoglycan-binding domain-containing protein [Solirubrobacteraceae bacterium]